MTRRYLVKIEDSILPQSYSFDELIDAGLLDNVDENIKVKLEGDSVWITARDYPFSEVENTEGNTTNTINPQQHSTSPSVAPQSRQHRSSVTSHSGTQHSHLNERTQNVHVQTSQQREIQSQPTSPSILNTWNWGAFTLSWIWGVCNGIYWPLIMIVCNFIPYIGVLCSLGICVYLGFKGNEMAWTNAKKKGSSVYSFESTQGTWNMVGLILFALSILLSLLYVLFIML